MQNKYPQDGHHNNNNQDSNPTTRIVDESVFKQVYDSPASLPGKEKWVTVDKDVRIIEEILGMKPNTIRAPLLLYL